MLDEIRHFVLAVDAGTVTAAARAAGLSQPALTASLQRLEAAMGARLLHRGRRGTELTAEGEALLPHARAALAAVEDGRRAVAEITDLARGEVRVGGGATACTYLLPAALARFRQRFPHVRLSLREGLPDRLRAALDAGDLDLVVIAAEDGEAWLDDELILIASPDLEAPEAAPLVTLLPGSSTRALVEAHFPGVEIAMELGGISAVKGNVRAGIGVALVSRAAVAHDLRSGRLVEVPDPRTPIRRRVGLLHRGIERLSPAAAALRALLLDPEAGH
ncbi:MAG: LysR family transcriptional regulator [Myxococcales bacterium]|nr:LysR family transcriptional regulator [Myxococcales bacterium]